MQFLFGSYIKVPSQENHQKLHGSLQSPGIVLTWRLFFDGCWASTLRTFGGPDLEDKKVLNPNISTTMSRGLYILNSVKRIRRMSLAPQIRYPECSDLEKSKNGLTIFYTVTMAMKSPRAVLL